MRLIDADELIHLYFDDENGKPVFDFVPWEFIENAPTIEAEPTEAQIREYLFKNNYTVRFIAEPRKRGHWIMPVRKLDMPKCSVCGVMGVENMNYCPNCGADMREVKGGKV